MEVTTAKGIGAKRLGTPKQTVEKLQKSLQAKAKRNFSHRFYSLWDKVYRGDVLSEAYQQCRRNGGIAGADEETFESIEEQGRELWLKELKEELKNGKYNPKPLLRVMIPKSNGGERALSIPCIRDRVVQTAMLFILGPIFDVDFHPYQYGFRSKKDAKMAVAKVYFQVTAHRRLEIVDGDLSDYFNTIPHGALMRCLARRICDGTVLNTIKRWLQAPVVKRRNKLYVRTTEAKDLNRGAAQGGPISPLLSNIYFRRFMVAWEKFGLDNKLDSRVINYADDLVVCCSKGHGKDAMKATRLIMGRLGLTLNEQKTRLINVQDEPITFLGYELGMMYGKDGKRYFGSRPSPKAVKRILKKIHDETTPTWNFSATEARIEAINRIIRGWCNYFNHGPVGPAYAKVREYSAQRVRRWLTRKHKRRGMGYNRYPNEYLYGELGLFRPPNSRASRASAKAC